MRIAVTGASGFIGTELLAELRDRNHKVMALTRGESARADSPCCIWKKTDYSSESLASLFDGVDTVIHLAGARGTSSDPAEYAINEEITANILQGMSAAGVKRIVFASTISVYDDVSLIPWTETSTLKGRTMYGTSKIRCEELIRASGSSYAIVRIAQVLGLGERRRGMMNVFIDAAATGGELKVIGKSDAKRQYIYVNDLVNILTVLAEDTHSLTVNAGMPNAYTNLEIANIVNKVYANSTPINYDDTRPESIRSSFMDITRLETTLGIIPRDMEQALNDMRITELHDHNFF